MYHKLPAHNILIQWTFSENIVDIHLMRLIDRSLVRMGIRLIDIACNLTDGMFRGVYSGKQAHEDDLLDVLKRAKKNGVETIIITGTTLNESKKAIQMANDPLLACDDNTFPKLYATVGCHPTRCLEFEEKDIKAEEYMEQLRQLTDPKNKVVAAGEFGLDYLRIMFCPVDCQRKYFELQLQNLTRRGDGTMLPLFLHCRNAADDMIEILSRNREYFKHGVVHSFDGTLEQARQFMDLGLCIGLNGCSLRTEQNLEVVSQLPVDKILLETDAPYCDIRSTHPSFKHVKTTFESRKKEKFEKGLQVRSRNEPCNIVQVLEVISAVTQVPVGDLAETVYRTTKSLFNI